jgi:lysozyme family protein
VGDFRRAIDIIIATHEGWFQKRPDDSGNWTSEGVLKGTKFGISAHSFPDIDIEALTLTQAEDLYRQNWGHFAEIAEIADQRVMTKVLDLAVNMQWGDRGDATLILQRAIVTRGIPVSTDGVFGPRTVTACNNLPADEMLKEICNQAQIMYAHIEAAKPEMKAWFNVWRKRAAWMPMEEAASA